MNRYRPWERDLAMRQARTPDEARARTARGAALVRAALNAARTGRPAPDLPPPSAHHQPRPAGYEYVSCAGCYRPVLGLPGTRCTSCPPPPKETTHA
ncbi:hypothetical protein ACQSSU_20475 [Micromonospora echinospora]